MKHATLFYKMLVVYVFAFLAAIIFPTNWEVEVKTAQVPSKVITVSAPQGAVLVKASTAGTITHAVATDEPVTISH
ncbi:MAG: hypothetical protein KDJ17_01695 [Hyphomicrobiaceae bacterium]|nr:hypothetical protein [Hyphomicrobiaceae bacterium]